MFIAIAGLTLDFLRLNIFFVLMIEIKNVGVIKAGKELFKNFSWRTRSGDNWIVRGPNGSGKTLFLEMLSGMAHVSHGEIHYDFIGGKSWDARFAQKKALITYIPAQTLQLFVHGQDLFYQQRYYSMDDTSVATVRNVLGDDIVKLDELNIPTSLSITHLLDVEVSRLSNGQIKKLLIVKSFLKGIPRLLLLDYPFEGLDSESRVNLSGLIDFVAKHHRVQIVLVDHHYKPACINKILTLHNFKIEKIGNVEEDISSPRHEVSVPMQNDRFAGPAEIIRIDNLNLKYGNYVVFKEFSWLVHKGERWALTGRNGAGKTTLFSLIFADHPQAYAQHVFLFGRRRGTGESIWDIKSRINYLGPEQVTFLDSRRMNLTVRDYIQGVSAVMNGGTFEHLTKHFDAWSFIDKTVNTLSSGELQLLMIFICFLSEKELWLLDEPFQFLDPVRKDRLKTYLSAHLRKDVTFILITHNDDDLAEWTDKRKRLQ